MLNRFYDSINEHNIFLGNNERFTLPQMQIPSYSLYNFNNISMMNIFDEVNLEDCVNINNIASYNLTNKSELKKINFTFISSKNNEEISEPELYTSNNILNIFNKEQNKDLFKENFKKLKFT